MDFYRPSQDSERHRSYYIHSKTGDPTDLRMNPQSMTKCQYHIGQQNFLHFICSYHASFSGQKEFLKKLDRPTVDESEAVVTKALYDALPFFY